MPVSKCRNYDYNKKIWKQIEFDLNLKTYPCCFWYWEKKPHGEDMKVSKEYFENELISQIHGKNPDPICLKYCNDDVMRENSFYGDQKLIQEYINKLREK